jgi:MYXO-CTERM domain-containing protein
MPNFPARLSCLSLLAGLHVAAPAQTVLVSYTFEDTAAAVIGASRSTLTWNSGAGVGYTSPFTGQGRALSVGDFQMDEYFQITLDATGYSTVVLNSFRSNGSIAAPRDWKISYSLAGVAGSFVDAATYTLASNIAADSTTIAGFQLPSGANHNPFIVVRLVANSTTRVDGGASAGGTVRLDNISFAATVIPEPSTYAALAGLMALGLHGWHRRRRSSTIGEK